MLFLDSGYCVIGCDPVDNLLESIVLQNARQPAFVANRSGVVFALQAIDQVV
jgi:hypothetical protein